MIGFVEREYNNRAYFWKINRVKKNANSQFLMLYTEYTFLCSSASNPWRWGLLPLLTVNYKEAS